MRRSLKAKLSDPGLAKWGMLRNDGTAESVVSSHSTMGYTPDYADPCYTRDHKYGPFSDVYSLGLVLLQMLTAKHIGGEPVALCLCAQQARTAGASCISPSLTGCL